MSWLGVGCPNLEHSTLLNILLSSLQNEILNTDTLYKLSIWDGTLINQGSMQIKYLIFKLDGAI